MNTSSEMNKMIKSGMCYHKDYIDQIFIVMDAILYVATKFYTTKGKYNMMIKGHGNLSMWDLVSRSFH